FQHLSLFQDHSHDLPLLFEILISLNVYITLREMYFIMINLYFINLLISLNCGCSAVCINSKSAISTEVTVAPSDFILSIAISLFANVREDVASTTISTLLFSWSSSLTV